MMRAAILRSLLVASVAGAIIATGTAGMPSGGMPIASGAPVGIESSTSAQLREIIGRARVDNQATAEIMEVLPAGDARLVRDQLNRLRDSAGALSAALSASRGSPSAALARNIVRLGSQASALRSGASSLASALSILDQVRRLALEGLRSGLAGGFPASFDATQYRWSAAGAHALADVTAARSAIRALVPLKRAPTGHVALEQARRGVLPAPVAGWTPIPGGCALPTASTADFLPGAAAQAPRLWTSPGNLAAHRARLESPTPALAAANAKTLRQALALSADAGRPSGASEVTKRVLSVGYAWLVTGESRYRDALVEDAGMLATASVVEPVEEAKEGLILATILDWLRVPNSSSDGLRQVVAATQVLKVKTIGTLGCSLALGENIAVDKLNKSVIVGSGAVMSAIALAQDPVWRPGMAATVKAGLLGARSGMQVLDVDGGSPEGPVYWNFQTVPAAGMLSSIDASLPERTVATVPALRKSGRYAWQMAAPSLAGEWETTRYSDTRDTVLRSTLPAWIAGKFGDRDAIAVALQGQLRQGVELLWWPRDEVDAPLGDAVFPRSGVAVIRSGAATAWLLGQPEITNHTQLDAGAVTVRVDGIDWSLDAGYGVEGPGYSEEKPDGRRWTYPQTQPAWHSTIRTARSARDLGQVVGATADLALAGRAATVDLTAVLDGASRAERRIMLSESALTVMDIVTGARQAYAWSWVTQASVRREGNSVVLAQDGARATLAFDGLPAGATISTSKVPSALGMPGTRIQVEFPAAERISVVATLRWSR